MPAATAGLLRNRPSRVPSVFCPCSVRELLRCWLTLGGRRMSNTVPRFRSIFWKLGKIMESVKAAAQLRYLGDRHAAQLDSPDSLYPPSE